jgi:hypothetical protein
MATGSKTGGREAGTPNKVTKELRDRLNALIQQEFDSIDGLLSQLEPKERLDVLVRLMRLVLPKPENDNQGIDLQPQIIWIETKSFAAQEVNPNS